MTSWQTVCATGHRTLPPSSLPWLRVELLRIARILKAAGTTVGISGMALGADTLWAQAVLAAGLELHAYVPFVGQELLWRSRDQEVWQALCGKAAKVVVLAGVPSGQREAVRLLHARNDAMLRDSAAAVCIWNPIETAGGTYSTVRKAARLGLPTVHVDPVAMVTHGPGCSCVRSILAEPVRR